jgi:hypothetical protein
VADTSPLAARLHHQDRKALCRHHKGRKQTQVSQKHANFITLLASITLSPKKKSDFNFYGDDSQIMEMKSIWDKRRGNSISVIFETRASTR